MIDSNKKLKKFIAAQTQKVEQKNLTTSLVSKYFGEVGSTDLEHIPYALQLKLKTKVLNNIFKGVVNEKLLKTLQVEPSPKINEYRLKMEFVCDFNPKFEPNNRYGQRKKKNFSWVINMEESYIFSNNWFKKSKEIFNYLVEQDVPVFDRYTNIGELKYIVLKHHKEECMLNIVLHSKKHLEEATRACELAIKLGFKSVHISIQDSLSDTAEGKLLKTFGKEYINVQVKDKHFKLTPYIFFQNNILCFEKIFDYIKDYVDATDTLYDLYAGTGVIGILLSDSFKKVIGIEIDSENVKQGKENLSLNKVKNYEFLEQDLNKLDIEDSVVEKGQIVIVDPPRVGLENNGVNNVLKLKPSRIIYISCNPVTQARDVLQMTEAGYKVTNIKGFDMFPHTNHLESVVILEL